MTKYELKDPLENGLVSGPMTGVTPEIKELIDSGEIKGEGIEFVENLTYWIREHFEVPKPYGERPNRLKRTAHEILFPDVDGQGLGKKKRIGTCTEHGNVVRALLVAKGIPTIWVETIDEEWIAGKYPKGYYSGHIFLEVYVDGGWRVLNTTAHPRDRETFLLPIEDGYKCSGQIGKVRKIHEYRTVARGLDSRAMWSEDRKFICLNNKDEWHEFVDVLFPGVSFR